MENISNTGSERFEDGPASIPDAPLLGYRNYWYPVVEARCIGRRPISVKILGEDIVLFPGKDGKVAALVDRCPHRGTMLSRGRILFPGTLSCGYHGWTYNETGECVAAIIEGPESKVPGNIRVRAYATEERFGIIWAFIGEGEPPPLDEDLPPELKEPGTMTHFTFREWQSNWRNVVENYPDILHAPYVHRKSIEVFFNKLPAWAKCHFELLPDGKGMHVRGIGGGLQGDYPGAGKFPARLWWRVLRRRYKRKEWSGESTAGGDIRMPGNIVVKVRDTYCGIHISNMGWPVPIDEHRTRHLNFLVTYPSNPIHRLALKIWYNLYFRHVHQLFLRQDRRQIEVQHYHQGEHLSNTDIALIQWRKLAPKIARQVKNPTGAVTRQSSKQAKGQDENAQDVGLSS